MSTRRLGVATDWGGEYIVTTASYYGTNSQQNGTNYWTLNARDADRADNYVRTDVPVVVGEPALLVLKMQFGDATDTVSLYVNPRSLGRVEPATPSGQLAVTAWDLEFSSVHFYPGDGAGQGSGDEIRIGRAFAGVTPPRHVPTGCSLIVR